MTKPWFRQYRREEGSFAQLPLYVRGLASEILKLTDDDGVIHIGRKAPWEAIAFALGATTGERRMLRRDVQLLLDDGFIEHRGETLIAPNFPFFQNDDGTTRRRAKRERSTTRQRVPNVPAPSEARAEHDSSTSAERTVHENESMSAESDSTVRCRREEERRGEKRREHPTGVVAVDSEPEARVFEEPGRDGPAYDRQLGVAPPPPPKLPTPTLPEIRAVIGAYEAAWVKHSGDEDSGQNWNVEHQRVIEVWRWAFGKHPEDPLALIRKAAHAACANPVFRGLGSPWAAFVKAPGRNLVPIDADAGRHGSRRGMVPPSPDHEFREGGTPDEELDEIFGPETRKEDAGA